jgi:hypothetical protein
MLLRLEDIIREWKFHHSRAEMLQDFLHEWFVPVYDHSYNFVGYRRKGDYNDSL